jgi:hypothetical protein
VAGEGKNGQDAVVRPHCLSYFAQRQRVGSEEIKHPHLIGGLNLNPPAAPNRPTVHQQGRSENRRGLAALISYALGCMCGFDCLEPPAGC